MTIEDRDDDDSRPTYPNASERVRVWLIFVLSAAIAACAEFLLWKYEPIFSFILALLVWVLASSRLYPRRTPILRALSNGVIVGVAILAFLFIFGFIR